MKGHSNHLFDRFRAHLPSIKTNSWSRRRTNTAPSSAPASTATSPVVERPSRRFTEPTSTLSTLETLDLPAGEANSSEVTLTPNKARTYALLFFDHPVAISSEKCLAYLSERKGRVSNPTTTASLLTLAYDDGTFHLFSLSGRTATHLGQNASTLKPKFESHPSFVNRALATGLSFSDPDAEGITLKVDWQQIPPVTTLKMANDQWETDQNTLGTAQVARVKEAVVDSGGDTYELSFWANQSPTKDIF